MHASVHFWPQLHQPHLLLMLCSLLATERRALTAWVWENLRGGMLLSAIEKTVSATKNRQTSGQQIADSNIPTLTVAGVHIACRNNLHGAAARQLQSVPMTLWKTLAAELLVIPHPDICITIPYASQKFCRCIPAYVFACLWQASCQGTPFCGQQGAQH